MNPAIFANPAIFNAYQQDPSNGYAQALLQQGTSTAPVRSPLEGLARALQAPLGGYMQNQVRGRYLAQDANYRAALAAALKGDDPVAALAASSDPTLQGMGLQQQLELGQARAKAKIDLQNQLMNKGLTLGPDGSVQAVPNFGTAQGQIAGQATLAQLPADVAKATTVGKAMIPVNAAGAAANASATAPIDVNKAIQIAQGTAPIDIAKATQVYNNTQGPQNLQNNKEKLRDDYRQDQNIKNYQVVAPIMASIKQAANTDSRAAELNMIYGFAKIMDPNSVVREGEQILVQGTGTVQDMVTNLLSRVQGGQPLTVQTRAELIAQAQSRVDQLKGIYDMAQTNYADQAKKLGLEPNDVFYQLPLATSSGQPASNTPRVLNYDANGNEITQ